MNKKLLGWICAAPLILSFLIILCVGGYETYGIIPLGILILVMGIYGLTLLTK